jgi:hypothetical protein
MSNNRQSEIFSDLDEPPEKELGKDGITRSLIYLKSTNVISKIRILNTNLTTKILLYLEFYKNSKYQKEFLFD